MKFKWLPLFFSAFIYLLFPFCAQAELKIGVMFFDPPLVISPIQGFHVDLANKICLGLQEKCVIKPMEWNRLFDAIDKGEIDLIMGVFYTPLRAQKYIFSIPYMISRGRFITLSKENITNFEQLKGRAIGTLQEELNTGVFADYIKAHYLNYFKVKNYKDVGHLLTALTDKSIKAALIHARSVNYWVANSSGIFTTLGPAFRLGEGYTIMALPARQELINNINKQLTELKANGDFARMYGTYFSDPPEL